MKEKGLNEVIDGIPVGRFHYRLLFVCGMCFCADSMEVSLLSFISICAGIEWNLSHSQIALIASSVFVGTLIGNLIFGPISDRYGRRPTFIIAGTGSSFAPNFISLVLLRTICGIGIGGVVIPYDLLAELMPSSARGQVLSSIGAFWAMGSVFIAGLAWIILSNTSWQYLTLIAAIPVTISLLLGIFILPESPRWLNVIGRKEEAIKIIYEAGTYNKTPVNSFKLSNESYSIVNNDLISPFLLLLSENCRLISLSVWSLWFFYGYSYYTVILFTIRIFSQKDSNSQNNDNIQSTCSFQYGEIFIGSLSEVLGVFICSLLVDRFGRLTPLRWSFGICGVCTLILSIWMNSLPTFIVTLIAYFTRCSVLCGVSAIWLSTPEFFPTSTRVTGHAIASGMSRIGSFIAPFITQSSATINQVSFILALASFATVICTTYLPETKGRDLAEFGADINNNYVNKRPRRVLKLLQRNSNYEYLDDEFSDRGRSRENNNVNNVDDDNNNDDNDDDDDEEEKDNEIVIRL